MKFANNIPTTSSISEARSDAPRHAAYPSFLPSLSADLRLKSLWLYESASLPARFKTLFTDGTAAMILYRLMQSSRRWHLAPLEMLFNKLNAICCNCIIGRGAQFGPGFVLIHATGVVINGNVRGGTEIYIEHQVTIGAERRNCPVLENGIFIGAGAKIIGAVHIGDGARIGANAVVIDDVPAHSTVVGVPAREVRRRDPIRNSSSGSEPPMEVVPFAEPPPQCGNSTRETTPSSDDAKQR